MIFGITFNFNILPLRTPSAGAFCVEWLQGGFTVQPCRGAVGVWCGTRTRIVIFEWASVAALWPGLRGMPHFRSAPLSFCIVLEGQRTVGRALHKRCYPRGNGGGTLPFHLRFGELMNLAVFPLAKLEWTSTTGKGT